MARILVAEDDDAVREFIERALTHSGHEVTATHVGIEALEALARESFDLLLTDIVMPELDGIALALKVSKDYPDIAILLMSGFAAERQRAHNLDVLIHRVISKPFTLDEICTAAKDALEAAGKTS
ncbi:MAG: response regulator [Alphaproteobacteria bacterium]